jgi:hypothetical protein
VSVIAPFCKFVASKNKSKIEMLSAAEDQHHAKTDENMNRRSSVSTSFRKKSDDSVAPEALKDFCDQVWSELKNYKDQRFVISVYTNN